MNLRCCVPGFTLTLAWLLLAPPSLSTPLITPSLAHDQVGLQLGHDQLTQHQHPQQQDLDNRIFYGPAGVLPPALQDDQDKHEDDSDLDTEDDSYVRQRDEMDEDPDQQFSRETRDLRAFTRLGRAPQLYTRLGRARLYTRIGRSAPPQQERVRRAPQLYTRIGRAPQMYTRLGRAPQMYTRIGRAPQMYMRIGRANSLHTRLGRSSRLYTRMGRSYARNRFSSRFKDDLKRADQIFTRIGRSSKVDSKRRQSLFTRMGRSPALSPDLPLPDSLDPQDPEAMYEDEEYSETDPSDANTILKPDFVPAQAGEDTKMYKYFQRMDNQGEGEERGMSSDS